MTSANGTTTLTPAQQDRWRGELATWQAELDMLGRWLERHRWPPPSDKNDAAVFLFIRELHRTRRLALANLERIFGLSDEEPHR